MPTSAHRCCSIHRCANVHVAEGVPRLSCCRTRFGNRIGEQLGYDTLDMRLGYELRRQFGPHFAIKAYPFLAFAILVASTDPMKDVRKAVFPVAGLGTRFLPATKAMPKEMLPVVDRPLIQHVVDEAREAGIEHFIFVTGRNKGVIEDHFDRQFELEMTLLERQKHEALEFLQHDLPIPGSTSFTRQQEPLGLGHAVWCARELVGHEPFALLCPTCWSSTRAAAWRR